jgi:hypothetical protein
VVSFLVAVLPKVIIPVVSFLVGVLPNLIIPVSVDAYIKFWAIGNSEQNIEVNLWSVFSCLFQMGECEAVVSVKVFCACCWRVCCTIWYKDEHKVIFLLYAIEVGFQSRIIIYTYSTRNKNEVIAGRSVNSWIQALSVVMVCGMYINLPFVVVVDDIYKWVEQYN